jgi:hypothetical protein
MESVGILLNVILVLTSVIFCTLLGLMYRFDKLQKAVNELKGLIEK